MDFWTLYIVILGIVFGGWMLADLIKVVRS